MHLNCQDYLRKGLQHCGTRDKIRENNKCDLINEEVNPTNH